MLCSILELIDLVKSGVKKSAAPFISFARIVPIPVAYLEFNLCMSCFILVSFTKRKKKLFLLHEIKMIRNFLFAI